MITSVKKRERNIRRHGPAVGNVELHGNSEKLQRAQTGEALTSETLKNKPSDSAVVHKIPTRN